MTDRGKVQRDIPMVIAQINYCYRGARADREKRYTDELAAKFLKVGGLNWEDLASVARTHLRGRHLPVRRSRGYVNLCGLNRLGRPAPPNCSRSLTWTISQRPADRRRDELLARVAGAGSCAGRQISRKLRAELPESSTTTIFMSETPKGFYAQLDQGKVPSWMTPVGCRRIYRSGCGGSARLAERVREALF